MTKNDTLREAKSLSRDLTTGRLEMGGILARIVDEGWYLPKYYNLAEYAWTELGMKKSTSYALINAHRTALRLEIPHAAVARLGWSKFHLLTPHLTADNWRSMMEHAATAPRRRLEGELRGPTSRGLQKSFNGLDQDGLDTIDRALGDIKARGGADTEAEAIVVICDLINLSS